MLDLRSMSSLVSTEPTKEPPKKSRSVAKKPANIQLVVEDVADDPDASKKKGRKPRGGKLIIKQTEISTTANTIPNIILHLKCSNRDLLEYNAKMSKLVKNPLEYNPDVPPHISSYNEHAQQFTSFDFKPVDHSDIPAYQEPNAMRVNTPMYSSGYVCPDCNVAMVSSSQTDVCDTDDKPTDNANMKEINTKLKQLKIQLYKNYLAADKKSACFWCTYEFDNAPCYIPKYEMDDTIFGYGSFCRPECAVAYLMKENMDDSTKFERYHLLNQIYSKVYNCKKNIKPAPNPYYLLDKFYGNLSIQEYRKLLKTEHLFMVIDKPLTRILPELHEDNEDLIMNIYGMHKPNVSNASASGVYKVKRQSEKQQGPSKTSIIRNKFGLQ